MSPLRVALIGLGTVGSGVAKILTQQTDRVAMRAGRPIEVRRVVDLDLRRTEGLGLPDGIATDDVQSVVDDDQIDVAVQLIGGVSPARQIMLALLQSGKHVVTANKALLSEYGDELFQTAHAQGRCIGFEAAVAGGIPIIEVVGQSMSANQITSIEAILNGTSNFILTEMLSEGRSYADAVQDAQDQGFAEADPSMDVQGTDAAQKLSLLCQLAFGTRVPLSAFPCRGIDSLELADLQYADELGYTVKLLAVARLVQGQLEMHVQPTLVRRDRPLAKVDGPFNMIDLEGDVVGHTWYSGAGAGQMPTASAVVSDVIDIAVGRAQLTFSQLDLWQQRPPLPVQPAEQISGRYYLRYNVQDRPHVLADIADTLGRHGISIASVIQHEAPEIGADETPAESIVPLVIMTHRTTEGDLRAADEALDKLTCLRPPRIRMAVSC